jgi:hypothetical protein
MRAGLIRRRTLQNPSDWAEGMMSTPSMSLRQEGDAELGDEEAGIGREGRCGWIDRGVGAVVELQLR